ncbi:hypothetical protein CAAN1_14S03048 [[Candida] anglica]|uniref:AD domain-containing protein n=1 Tax=[Candida] anglica TaxID=148631 RepID=A0ABP0EKP2_9ASCO
MNSIEQALDLKVKISTLLDQSHTGYIYAYSPVHELLTLRITNHSTNKIVKPESYKFINTAFIKTIQVLAPFPKKNGPINHHNKHQSHSPSPPPPQSQPTSLSINELETKLNRAVADYKVMLSKSHNPKASSTAVMLYEKLYLSFDSVTWQNECIIVSNQIKISRPYSAKSCTKLQTDSKILDKVQLAIKEFWDSYDIDKQQ